MHIPFIETIAAMCGIMLMYHFSSDLRMLTKYKWYQVISRNSYGIYLFHVVIIYMMFYLSRNISVSPYLFAPVVYLISIGASILLAEWTRKLGIQFVIGEKKRHE